jgi:hypothetical protein
VFQSVWDLDFNEDTPDILIVHNFNRLL